MRIGFFFGLNIILSVLTLFLYYSSYIPPSVFWPSSILPLLIPAFIVLNILFLLYWLFKFPKRALLSLLVLILGYSYFLRTYSIHWNSPKEEAGSIRIVSYNVRVFNSYNHLKDKDYASSKKMIAWVAANPAEIICLQEFYDEKSDTIFNAVKRISKTHPYYNFKTFFVNKNVGASFGMVIFSTLPILNKGMLRFSEKTNNQILFADVKKGKDTIRVYNIHLQSLSLEEDEIKVSGNFLNLMKKLKHGSVQRSRQIQILDEHIQKCPYATILICGDLNDTPYSYSYQNLRGKFHNSFEEAGQGFGFTYNGKLFLRIDNQFASKNVKVSSFKVHEEIKYSDHFPIEGIYSLN